tara:strand:+ start:3392 stop:3805 length:414 start_codon:yes stop_codon:yes gene_type:complete
MSILTQFNTQLSDLISELIYLYPENKRFAVFNQKLDILRSVNPKLIIEKYIEFIYPFKAEILSEDDAYFTSKTNVDNIKDIYKSDNIKNQNYVPIESALNLKDIWVDMNDETKSAIWKYFKVLILLSEKWFASKYNK